MEERRPKILAVDDNPKNIQVIGSILKKADYDVGFAFDGKQALDLLGESNDYDLVLLDVNMPVMNGYETCFQIRKNPEFADIPVIFLTALAEVDNIVKGFESGAQDYVSKPFNARELLSRVQTHIELRQSRLKLKQVNMWLEEKVKERTTELQKANEQLAQANMELEKLDEAKTNFLGIISHQINTPLNGIIGFTNILKEELKNDEFYELIEFLDLSATRLERFVSLSLLITELKTEKKIVRKTNVSLTQFLPELTKEYDNQIQHKGLIIDFPKSEITVKADLHMFEVALRIIFENAIKFSPDKGVISIRAASEVYGVAIEIADQGTGFASYVLNSPFELFTKISERKDEDKGLGLALAKLILDAHQGNITLRNLPDGGAAVSLFFPRD